MIRIKKYIVIGLVAILIVVFGRLIVLWALHGTPWGKASFKQSVDNYISKHYPTMVKDSCEIGYSFKEGQYSAAVKSENIIFLIKEGNEGMMYDNYLAKKIGSQLNFEVEKAVTDIFGVTSKISVDISSRFNSLVHTDQNISYSDLNDEYKSDSTIYVNLQESLEDKADILTQCYTLLKWAKDNKYEANVTIKFLNNYKLDVDFATFSKLNSSDELDGLIRRSDPILDE
ncbi:hypothetical protein G8C92_30870 [Paenibacillus donghaensis]|uniref:YfjL-like protein n=1 Tax=Paenibacillus donghaensis TaxID=414771 RepID=UPI001883EB82|nr:hypothetical protein [Paenibacillus donghaensis]MBE9918401.1 hypothetical protein [Paenibacillus donghaensis]